MSPAHNSERDIKVILKAYLVLCDWDTIISKVKGIKTDILHQYA